SATDSTSETLAATPKAVKTAYDLANGKYTAQDATTGQKGIVQLSSATDSTSETLAATPKAVKAANDNANGRVPASGGRVAYLENATYYKTNPAGWYGGGAFADQYRNNAAPFLVPYGFASVKDTSQYLPIVKGISHTEGYGYAASVSFGILRSGKADFGSAVIHIIGDNGTAVAFSFGADGGFYAPGQITNKTNIVAGQGLYESGGAVRAYSPNNPPPQQDLSHYATQSWVVANFGMVNGIRRGGQQLQNPTDAFFGNWESPAGCVVTGITMEGRSDGRKLGVYYRQMQYFNIQANAWVNIGD
ncbi:phage tail protein, partial [Enterobacter asburiae]|uniref:phage tail protein n=1 Tax=Enterobacter asburiae TaxID=61645 RepID=UPI001FFE3E61